MKIAMLTNEYKPLIGGIPISIERLSEGLRNLGHEVYIFAPTYANQEEEPYVIRYKFFRKKLKGSLTLPYPFDSDVEKAFASLNFDIIHVHHPAFCGWMATYLGKKYDIPIAYTYHTHYEEHLRYMGLFNKCEELFPQNELLTKIKTTFIPYGMKSFANKCDIVFAPTPLMQTVLENMRVTTPIEVLPTGLNPSFFKQHTTESKQIRNTYKGNKKYLFCSVSRLSSEKNISFIIEGLKSLKSKQGDCFRMLLIGDGPLKSELEQQVKTLDLIDNVVFLSNVPNKQISAYYKACDLFLFASKSKTQGIAVLEAMASSAPVIALKATGVVDIIKNDINGYVTDPHLESWVSKIEYLLEHPKKMRLLKLSAYETATHYSNLRVAMMAESCYRKTIEICGFEKEYHLYDLL